MNSVRSFCFDVVCRGITRHKRTLPVRIEKLTREHTFTLGANWVLLFFRHHWATRAKRIAPPSAQVLGLILLQGLASFAALLSSLLENRRKLGLHCRQESCKDMYIVFFVDVTLIFLVWNRNERVVVSEHVRAY